MTKNCKDISICVIDFTSPAEFFFGDNIIRKYYQLLLLYFSAFRLNVPKRHRRATAERNSSNRFRETRRYPKFSDLMCLDFVTYCYCCRTLWPLYSSLEAVTVGNFSKARLLLSFENRLCFKLTFSLEYIKHSRTGAHLLVKCRKNILIIFKITIVLD